jgi:hypothetical protein
MTDCLFQTACFARGDKRNDGSTFVLLSFRLWRKSKPPAIRVVVDSYTEIFSQLVESFFVFGFIHPLNV